MQTPFRFRLRTLLVLTALAAAACWWLVAPTRVALEFKYAVESANYSAADAMFVKSGDSLFELFTRDAEKSLRSTPDGFALEVRIRPRTWRDLVRRERRLALFVITQAEKNAGRKDTKIAVAYAPELLATARGIKNLHAITHISRF